MQHIRSLFFDIVFYTFSIFYFGLIFPFIFIFKDPFVLKVYFIFAKCQRFLMRKILKLEFSVTGKEHLDALKGQNYIVAMQHQSAFDTFIPPLIIDNFCIVLKRELFYIPIFGFYLKKLPAIFINRKQGISSLKNLLKESKRLFKKGKNLLIYPEGTRQPPFIQTKCQPGIYSIYKELHCKVVPISLNSGLFWPRKAPFKKSGCIDITIHPPILEGKSKQELLEQLNTVYNNTCKTPLKN
ncbi:MAG: hypothetical protein HEEMFOPI_01181 [Holosporales bacterium]